MLMQRLSKTANSAFASACLLMLLSALPGAAGERIGGDGADVTAEAGGSGRCGVARVSGADQAIRPDQGINQGLIDAAIRAEINAQRCRAGLGALRGADSMARIAQTHAKYMARTLQVSHKSSVPGQGSLKARMSTSGMKMRVGSENVGMVHRYRIDGGSFRIISAGSCQFATNGGQAIGAHSYGSLARKIVGLWMASSGHRRNILDRKVTMVGSGAAFNGKTPYCGQFFISQNFVG